MISVDAARTVVGIVGNVTALGLFLSPMPTFFHIWKKRSVEQFSPNPYLAALLNCSLWMLFGLPMVQPHCILIVTINGSGFLIELFYILMFIYYSDRKKRMQVLVMLLLEVCFSGAVAAFVLLVVHTPERRTLIVGSLCVFFTTLMYAAPLSVMKNVIRTRSVEFLPFYLSVASFTNGACWTAYALIRFDLFVTIANGVGVLMGLIQLGLHAAFYKSTKKQLGARRALGETGLAEIVLIGDTNKVCNAPEKGHATQSSPSEVCPPTHFKCDRDFFCFLGLFPCENGISCFTAPRIL